MYFCNKVLSYSFSMNLRIQYNFFLCLQFSNSTSWWEDYSSENTGVTSSYTDSKKKKKGGGRIWTTVPAYKIRNILGVFVYVIKYT